MLSGSSENGRCMRLLIFLCAAGCVTRSLVSACHTGGSCGFCRKLKEGGRRVKALSVGAFRAARFRLATIAVVAASSCNFPAGETTTQFGGYPEFSGSASSSGGGGATGQTAGGSLVFAELPPSVTAGGSVAFTLVATGVSGAPIANAQISVSPGNGSASSTGVTDSTGTYSGSFSSFSTVVGVYTLSARLLGSAPLAASASFDVVPGALDHLGFSPGGLGSVAIGASLAFNVGAFDAYNNPEPGIALTASSGSTTVTSTTSTAGIAAFNIPAFASTPGNYVVSVSATGVAPVTGTVTVTGGAASSLVFLSQPANAQPGVALAPFSIGASDAQGNATPIPGTSTCALALRQAPSGGALWGTSSGVAPSNGVVTFNQVWFQKSGTYIVSASCGGISGATPPSVAFTIATGATAILSAATPWPTNLSGGQTFGITLNVLDSSGNAIPSGSVSVALGAGPTGATLGGTTTISFTSGTATFSGLSITPVTSGGYTLVFTSSGITATSPVIQVTSVPAISSFTASSSPVVAGTTVTLSWNTSNALTVALSGQATTYPSGPGQAQVTPYSTTTYTLTATNADAQATKTVTVNVTAPTIAALVFTAQPVGTSAGNTLAPINIQGQTASGAPAPLTDGTACTLSFIKNPGSVVSPSDLQTTASNGVASFSQLTLDFVGSYVVSASCAGITPTTGPSNTFAITAGPLNSLEVSEQPPGNLSSGQSFTVAVNGIDIAGNPVSTGSVTVSLSQAPSGAMLYGTTTQSLIDGQATFPGLSLSTTISGSVTLQFGSGGVSATTNPITLSSAPQVVTTYYTPVQQSQSSYTSLPSNEINAIASSGDTVYVATQFGLGITTNGTKFQVKTMAQGLPNNEVDQLAVLGSSVFVPTPTGLYISQDGGGSFAPSSAFSTSTILDVAVFGSSVYVLWQVQNGVALSVSSDSGKTFQQMSVPLTSWSPHPYWGIPQNPIQFPPQSGLFVSSNGTIYLYAGSGLLISGDGGQSFQPATGIPSTAQVTQVYATAALIYAAVAPNGDGSGGGIWISNDGGADFTPQQPASGMGSNTVNAFVVSGSMVYAAMGTGTTGGSCTIFCNSTGGVSISKNGGSTYTNYTTANGLPSDNVLNVVVSGGAIYALTDAGLAVAPSAGSGFTVIDNASNSGVLYTNGSTVYAGINGFGLYSFPSGSTKASSDAVSVSIPDIGALQDGIPFTVGSGYAYFSVEATGVVVCNSSTLGTCELATQETGIGATLTAPGSDISIVSTALTSTDAYVLWLGTAAPEYTTDPNTGQPLGSPPYIMGISKAPLGQTDFSDTGWFASYTESDPQFVAVNNALYVTVDTIGVLKSTGSNLGFSFFKLPGFPAASQYSMTYESLYVLGNVIVAGAADGWGGPGTFGISTDGGTSVSANYSGDGGSIGEAVVTPNGNIYVGFSDGLYLSTNSGGSFSSVYSGNPGGMAANGNDLYIDSGVELLVNGAASPVPVAGLPFGEGANPVVSGGNVYSLILDPTKDDLALFTTPAQ